MSDGRPGMGTPAARSDLVDTAGNSGTQTAFAFAVDYRKRHRANPDLDVVALMNVINATEASAGINGPGTAQAGATVSVTPHCHQYRPSRRDRWQASPSRWQPATFRLMATTSW